jgi:5-formyltetrahydrofolate cyclo-ligase
MSIPTAKTALRDRVLMARSTRDPLPMGEAFRHTLAALPELQRDPVPSIAAYVSIGAEPGTSDLIDSWNAPVWLPVVTGRDLRWGRFTGTDELVMNQWGLHEPTSDVGDLPEDVVAIVMPALACDAQGHRLGRGGGYYDRFLARVVTRTHRPLLIALVYDDEVVDAVPQEPFDVGVDIVVTPTRVLRTAGG